VQGLPDAKVRRIALTAWWKLEIDRQRTDGVIGWVFKARDSDQRTVGTAEYLRVGGRTRIASLYIGAGGPENVSIGGAGAFATTSRGTPREESHRYPHAGVTSVRSSLNNAPTTHLGKALDRPATPLGVLQMTWDYLESLWYLSKSTAFGDHVQRELKKGRR
jgi:hypothetical protein